MILTGLLLAMPLTNAKTSIDAKLTKKLIK